MDGWMYWLLGMVDKFKLKSLTQKREKKENYGKKINYITLVRCYTGACPIAIAILLQNFKSKHRAMISFLFILIFVVFSFFLFLLSSYFIHYALDAIEDSLQVRNFLIENLNTMFCDLWDLISRSSIVTFGINSIIYTLISFKFIVNFKWTNLFGKWAREWVEKCKSLEEFKNCIFRKCEKACFELKSDYFFFLWKNLPCIHGNRLANFPFFSVKIFIPTILWDTYCCLSIACLELSFCFLLCSIISIRMVLTCALSIESGSLCLPCNDIVFDVVEKENEKKKELEYKKWNESRLRRTFGQKFNTMMILVEVSYSRLF